MLVTCDNCGKPIDVGDARAGQKFKCPACQDVFLVKEDAPTATAAVAVDRAAEAGYPSARGPEVDVLMIRRAMMGAHPLRFFGLMLLILAGAGMAVYFGTMVSPRNNLLTVVGGAAAAFALLVLAFWKIQTLGEGLRITTRRTIESKGFLSRATSDVLHKDIKNIQVKQTFGNRIWKVGVLALSSSAENEDEIVMHDVPDPEHVRQVIDLYRQS